MTCGASQPDGGHAGERTLSPEILARQLASSDDQAKQPFDASNHAPSLQK